MSCWNGTSIDNAIHTLHKTDFYIIVLDLYCFGHGHSAARPVSAGKRKVYTMYVTLKFPTQTTKSPGLDTTVLWPNETPTPLRALCFVWFALKLWCQLPANQHWKKHYDLKRKTKSGLFFWIKKLKNSRGHTWVPFVTTIHYYVTPYDTLSLFRENSFSDKLFISIESQKTSMYIGRYCIPNQYLSLKTWIQVADNVFVV